jgi:hypothetical protein
MLVVFIAQSKLQALYLKVGIPKKVDFSKSSDSRKNVKE